MRKIVAGVLAAWCLLAPIAARADHDQVLAEALFRQGRDAVNAGDLPTACEKFAQSYRLDPAAGTLLNLGDCEERRGRLASAWADFNRLFDTLAPNDDRRALARSRADAVAARLPKIRVMLASGTPPEARVFRDGVPIDAAAIGTSVPTDPGAHVFSLRVPDHADSSAEVKLAETEQRDVTLKPGAPLPHPVVAAPPPPEHHGLGGRRVAALVVGGASVLALGAGFTTGGVALGSESQSKAYCSGNVCFDQRGVDLHQMARTEALVCDILVATGVVALAASAVLWLTGKPHHAQVGLAPAAGGVVLGGVF